jgi:adenosine deaminase
MARNSLQYAFISGGTLWSDDARARKLVPVAQCAQDVMAMKLTSSGCQQYLASSQKAKLQWQLEEDFEAFERGF